VALLKKAEEPEPKMMMIKTTGIGRGDMIFQIALVLLLCEVGISIEAVEMNWERSPPSASTAAATISECPKGCRCTASDVIDCTGRNFTQPPIPIEDSKASDLLLEANRIAQIDLVFLKHYSSLRLLSLAGNGLRSLFKSIDSPIFSLVHLELNDNHLHVIHAYVLSGFPNLKSLNLSGNGLHTVSVSAFGLPALETLDLSRNSMPTIGVHLFETSAKLSEVNLASNAISRLNDGTFGHLTSLSLLDLSHNSLMRIEDNVFVGMNISHLDLGYNNLRKMPSLPLRKLTAARTLILDGNPLHFLGRDDLTRVRTEFLSISKCPHLEQIATGSLATLKDLKTLTINENPSLKYIAPGFIEDAPKLAAIDLSQNSLYALEYSALETVILKLRALYLNGNKFNCHCSLRWLAQLLIASDSKVQNGNELRCSNNGHYDSRVLLRDMAGQLSQECEPYILPLFQDHSEALMGKDVSWLCKALGSHDLELYWRLPHEDQTSGQRPQELEANMVKEGTCHQRACVKDNTLTVRYLHPADTGKYTCVAKNKFGKDQRKVVLDVKSEHIQIFPITVASTFVTLSWNTSGALSTGRGYILQVKRAYPASILAAASAPQASNSKDAGASGKPTTGTSKASQVVAGDESQDNNVKRYMDIDVGLKMNSYTVNGLQPGIEYLFELCLRKEEYIIPISSTLLTTRNSGYEVALGIETDYVTLVTVTLILTTLVISCFALSFLRWYTYHNHLVHMRSKGDNSSQREIIMSPSEHSSVTYPNLLLPPNVTTTNGGCGISAERPQTAASEVAILASGDESRLMEHEVTSPTEEVVGVRETIA
jgi:Leucine-rich repeat (LRR) protein